MTARNTRRDSRLPYRALWIAMQDSRYRAAAVMEQRNSEEIPLESELNLAKRYLDIMSLRSGDGITVSWSIAPEVRDALVPSFILQPLLENALQHGFSGQPETGHIVVSAVRTNDTLRLVVEDDGAGFDSAETMEGIGLSTTVHRLAELYGNASRVRLERGSSGGSRAIVDLPAQTRFGSGLMRSTRSSSLTTSRWPASGCAECSRSDRSGRLLAECRNGAEAREAIENSSLT